MPRRSDRLCRNPTESFDGEEGRVGGARTKPITKHQAETRLQYQRRRGLLRRLLEQFALRFTPRTAQREALLAYNSLAERVKSRRKRLKRYRLGESGIDTRSITSEEFQFYWGRYYNALVRAVKRLGEDTERWKRIYHSGERLLRSEQDRYRQEMRRLLPNVFY